MIDQASRSHARKLLKKFALGKLTGCECENEFSELYSNSQDAVIFALYRTIFEISGDADKPLPKLFSRGSEMRKRVCRWIFFLKSGMEYEWPKDRLAPGIKDFYKPNWFDKLFLLDSRIIRSNETFISQGDYQVWPFFRQSDFNAAKVNCARKRMTQTP